MTKTKYTAIIQARMLSQRLRGKSLMAVCGTPLLGWVIHRIKQMEFIDEVIVATSSEPADAIQLRSLPKAMASRLSVVTTRTC